MTVLPPEGLESVQTPCQSRMARGRQTGDMEHAGAVQVTDQKGDSLGPREPASTRWRTMPSIPLRVPGPCGGGGEQDLGLAEWSNGIGHAGSWASGRLGQGVHSVNVALVPAGRSTGPSAPRRRRRSENSPTGTLVQSEVPADNVGPA